MEQLAALTPEHWIVIGIVAILLFAAMPELLVGLILILVIVVVIALIIF